MAQPGNGNTWRPFKLVASQNSRTYSQGRMAPRGSQGPTVPPGRDPAQTADQETKGLQKLGMVRSLSLGADQT